MEITLEILRVVEKDESVTQRSAAENIGVALGLINTYFKRCVKKGFIKVRQVPANRYAYYLTPKGFAEKSRLTAEFLSQSLELFRQSRRDYDSIFERCTEIGWRSVAFYGVSDLVDLATLCAKDHDVELVGILDPNSEIDVYNGLRVCLNIATLGKVDGFVFSALAEPGESYRRFCAVSGPENILVPPMLELFPKRGPARASR